MKTRILTILFWITFFTNATVWAADQKPAAPTEKDRCPVCGMFVAQYPDFGAQILFKDGSRAFFDGAKDLFKYYLNMERFDSSRSASDIDAIYVTDYYSLNLIDGHKAHFVSGSNVYGPMGAELIAIEKESEANEFMVDHAGKSLLSFEEITEDFFRDMK